ncbi:MAG: hypothetical protein Q7S60_02150 [bacterium]|nr:hypothetical protein [bacterium]
MRIKQEGENTAGKVEFNLPIYDPESLTQRFSSYEIATFFSQVLNTVYQGQSYNVRGNSIPEYEKLIAQGTLLPFLVFDGTKPIASYSAQWYGATVDMGMAAILPEYRFGEVRKIRGRDLYLKAHRWVEGNLSDKIALITGKSTLPESAVIAYKYCRRWPCWIAPIATLGYPSELLEEEVRKQSFLLYSEKYPRGNAYSPKKVYLPKDFTCSQQIAVLWEQFNLHYPGNSRTNFIYRDGLQIPDRCLIYHQESDARKVIMTCNFDNQVDSLTIEDALQGLLSTGDHSQVPFTRVVLVEVPADRPESSQLQNSLLNKGFVFCGILPGIQPTIFQKPLGEKDVFSRQPLLLYGKLRPGIDKVLDSPTIPSLDNERLDRTIETICRTWQSN